MSDVNPDELVQGELVAENVEVSQQVFTSPEDMGCVEEAAVAAPSLEDLNDDLSNANKWHQNGFGDVVPKQTGKFSREESDIIKNAIEEYCGRKQISVKSLCSERDHKADLKGAWMEIARYLPNRSVQSVYRHGIRQCHPFKRGAWSDVEVSMLQDLVAHNGKKWSMIQTKLNRSADSCRDKVGLRARLCAAADIFLTNSLTVP